MRPRIILASSSPRRKMLLEQLHIHFDIRVSDVDEALTPDLPPEMQAERLALEKARFIAERVDRSDTLVIGADTIVVDGQEILGKPADHDDAFRMLSRLSGRTHHVITGLALIALGTSSKTLAAHETTQVKVASLSEQDILAYINTGEPLDKAGAYGIQGKGAIFIEWIHGCYNNVVGLPLFLLCRMFKDIYHDVCILS